MLSFKKYIAEEIIELFSLHMTYPICRKNHEKVSFSDAMVNNLRGGDDTITLQLEIAKGTAHG